MMLVLAPCLALFAGFCRVYDPACGSGGMFVQSEKFAEAHGSNKTDVSIFGQEFNPTTWRLAHMNLVIHGIEANLGSAPADTFLRDAHPDLKADFVLANPPFNVSDWSGQLLRGDRRWAFGDPPVGNANYAWIQHFIHHGEQPHFRSSLKISFREHVDLLRLLGSHHAIDMVDKPKKHLCSKCVVIQKLDERVFPFLSSFPCSERSANV